MFKINNTGRADFDKRYQKRKQEGKSGWSDGYPEKIARLEKLLNVDYIPKKGRFLELGCGAGNISLRFAEKGFDVYGIDISPTAVAWAQENSEQRHLKGCFQTGNVITLQNYSDGFFDFVLDGDCFQYIVGNDRVLFLTNVCRVMKPNGFFGVRTCCADEKIKESFYLEPELYFDPKSHCLINNKTPYAYIGLAENILDEIKKGGFCIMHWEIIKLKEMEDQPFVRGGLIVDTVKI